MPRTKTFDEADTLTQTMSVFWQKGYERTSMKDIERATKLSAGSVYHEFGGKKQLFERSLQHYIEQIIQGRITRYLQSQTSPIEGIRAFLISSIQGVPSEFVGKSCLLVNSGAELGQEDEQIGQVIKQGFKRLDHAMQLALESAKLKEEVPKELDSKLAASQLCMLMPGLLIAAKNDNSSEFLGTIVDFNLQQITSMR